MLLQYGFIVLNIQMVAAHSYTGTAATDVVLAFNSFTTMKWVSESKNNWEKLGYILGGVSGSLIALWVNIHIFHK